MRTNTWINDRDAGSFKWGMAFLTSAAVAGAGAALVIVLRLNWFGSDFAELASDNIYAETAGWVFIIAFLVQMIAGGLNGSIHTRNGKCALALSVCIAAFFLTAGWSGLFDVAKALVYIFSLLTLAILIAGVASFCADNADTALVTRQGGRYKNMPDTGLEPVICGILLVILAISAALLDGPASFCRNYTLYRVSAADPPDPITVCFTRFMLCAFPALAAGLWADANKKSFMHVLKVFFVISIIMLGFAAIDFRRCNGFGYYALLAVAVIGVAAYYYRFAKNKWINLLCFFFTAGFIFTAFYSIGTGIIRGTEGVWGGAAMSCGIIAVSHYIAAEKGRMNVTVFIMLSSVMAYISWAVLCDGNGRIIAGRPEKSDTIICLALLSSGMSTAITHIIRREHRILSAAILAIYAAVFFIPVLAGNSEFWLEFFSFTYLPSCIFEPVNGFSGDSLGVWSMCG